MHFKNLLTHLGLVFQMQDDYLDQYGNGTVLGKNRASDAANEKNHVGYVIRSANFTTANT